jgi:hypothetical protein
MLKSLMNCVTIKFGHFEINYGDAHFRRSDAGYTIHNPFVGNLIMDAFTTEVGGEVYVRSGPYMVMGSITNGEIRGSTLNPGKRKPAYIGKVGFDKQLSEAFRFRLTGSAYGTQSSVNNTLYSGSRAGSQYFNVLENVVSSEASQAWSGDIQPGLRSKVKAYVVNPFIKFHGLELFGNIETAEGRQATESESRSWNQYAGDVVYRFMSNERAYVGARYNTVKGELKDIPGDVTVDRYQFAAGWFLTNNLLAKLEYVNQKYKDFPSTDIRNGGEFKGVMFSGTVGF